MTPIKIFMLALLLPAAAALAQDGTPAQAADAPVVAEAPTVGPISAEGVSLAQFLWERRPVAVFADGPNDPQFRRQMDWITRDLAELDERDVVVITDTDPAARSDLRQRLRPRGFALVIIDKDGEVKMRKPQPWTVREITRAIDRFPLRRQEMLERRPSGR